MAYGVLMISPLNFGLLTPLEFKLALKGYYWKRQRDMKDMAVLIAHIVNGCGHLAKGKRARPTDYVRDKWTDPRNPFYRGLMGI